MRSLIPGFLVLLAGALAVVPAVGASPNDAGTGAAAVVAERAPDEQLATAAGELFEIVRRRAAAPAADAPGDEAPPGDAAAGDALLEARLLPLFDFHYMARLVYGRHWRQASDEQREALVARFRRQLLQTCYVLLAGFAAPAIEFRALPAAPGNPEVTVRSYVRHAGKRPTVVDYDMKRTGDGWKVVDIRMGGLGLIAVHRQAQAGGLRDNDAGPVATNGEAAPRNINQVLDSTRGVLLALFLMQVVTQRGGGG